MRTIFFGDIIQSYFGRKLIDSDQFFADFTYIVAIKN